MKETKYKNGMKLSGFKRLAEISSYNSNYHIGFDGDLLYLDSDDDNETAWYLVKNKGFELIGYSYTSDGDVFVEDNQIHS